MQPHVCLGLCVCVCPPIGSSEPYGFWYWAGFLNFGLQTQLLPKDWKPRIALNEFTFFLSQTIPFAHDVTAELIWMLMMLELFYSMTLLVRIHRLFCPLDIITLLVLQTRNKCSLCTYCIWFKSKLHEMQDHWSITLQHFCEYVALIKTRAATYWNHVLACPLVVQSCCWTQSCFRSMENKTHINDILIRPRVLLKGCWQSQGQRDGQELHRSPLESD